MGRGTNEPARARIAAGPPGQPGQTGQPGGPGQTVRTGQQIVANQTDSEAPATQAVATNRSVGGPTLPLALPALPRADVGHPAETTLPGAGEGVARAGGYTEGAAGPGGYGEGVARVGGYGAGVEFGAGRRAGRWVSDLAIDLIRKGRGGASLAIRLAADRAVAPNSLTGICGLLGLCAAAWFSGGTRQDDLRGTAVLAACVVARVGARHLAAATARRRVDAKPAKRRPVPVGQTWPGRTDWLVLPGFDWSGSTDQDGPPPRQPEPATPTSAPAPSAAAAPEAWRVPARQAARPPGFDWLYAVCTVAVECAIYGGIAAGAEAAGWPGTWPLAMITVILVSIADVGRACIRAVSAPGQAPPGQAQARQAQGRTRAILNRLGSIAAPPVGVKVLVAGLVAVGYGPRIALCTVVVIEAASLLSGVAAVVARRTAAGQATVISSAAELAVTAAGQDVLLSCRDDGPLARRAGWLVRGNLAPIPPALTGLFAVSLLAALGLAKLPGIIALAPVIVLLLAAPGSSHPHDGRFDCLVPVLLCLGQYVYLAALGLARAVPAPIVFAACSMTAVWYAGRSAGRPGTVPATTGPATTGPATTGPATTGPATTGPAALAGTVTLTSRADRVRQIMARRSDGIGWDGRVWLVAVAGMFGIATVGYLGLTACLGALMCRKVVIGYLIAGEDRRQ